jgi:hypothetical protein
MSGRPVIALRGAAVGAGLALLLGLVLLARALPARADGDPASDYLLVQSTFLSPFDGHVAPPQSARLIQLVADAQTQGFALKVAVIVTPYDLGSVPILFDKPQTYAKFLGQEDFYYWKDELLVVMPNGYGLFRSTGTPAADAAAIRRLAFAPTKSGTALVVAAQRAVRALARRRGITLAATAAGKAGGSASSQERREIGGAVLAALLAIVGFRLTRRRRRRSPRGPTGSVGAGD